MEQQQIEEVLECLSPNPTKFYYFKDLYAAMMLSYVLGSGMKIHEIKKTKYARLLDKPLVKACIRRTGSAILSRELIDSFPQQDYHCYLLTLDKWGGNRQRARFYNQTSRPGWNLVLQLNFSSRHNRAYDRLIRPRKAHPFKQHAHPIACDNGVHTLAWARLDFDLDLGEALIEEIQNDWIRIALKTRDQIDRYKNGITARYVPYYIRELGCDADSLPEYIENELKPHAAMWEEAMLMSAIRFIKEDIGISDIFYHTFDSGCQLKRIDHTRPPRSLYTRLPEKFCFEKSERVPRFLLTKNNRKTTRMLRGKERQFYLLSL